MQTQDRSHQHSITPDDSLSMHEQVQVLLLAQTPPKTRSSLLLWLPCLAPLREHRARLAMSNPLRRVVGKLQRVPGLGVAPAHSAERRPPV